MISRSKKENTLKPAPPKPTTQTEYIDFASEIIDKILAAYGFLKMELPLLEKARNHRKYFPEIYKKMVPVGEGGDFLRTDLRLSLQKTFLKDYLKQSLPFRVSSEGSVFQRGQREKEIHEKKEYRFEIIGSGDPLAEAMVIQIAAKIGRRFRLRGKTIINYLGDRNNLSSYKRVLSNYLKDRRKFICPECRKLKEQEVLRFFSCQEENCQRAVRNAPKITRNFSEDSQEFLKNLERIFKKSQIRYNLNPYYFPKDYYLTRTLFKIQNKKGPANIITGQRSDRISRLLGHNKSIPSIGVTIDLEKLAAHLKEEKVKIKQKKKPVVFLAHLGKLSKAGILKVFEDLTKTGINIRESFFRDTLRSQLNMAERLKSRWFLIVGQKEALEETIIVREMGSGVQQVLTLKRLFEKIKRDKHFLK